MFDSRRVAHDFSRASASYDAAGAAQLVALRTCAEMLAPAKGVHVLDIGCGTGRLAALLPDANLTGIDLSHGMCTRAQYPNGVAVADATRLPFSDNSFDAALCSLVLQWTDAQAALAEALRVCRPGANFCLSGLGANSLHELRDVLSESRVGQFTDSKIIEAWAVECGWDIFATEKQPYVQTAESFPAVLAMLKNIGATNKLPHRPRGLTPASVFRDAAMRYARDARGNFPVTWDFYYLHLRAPQ